VSLALPEALFFVGIDWATEIHAVCVLDPAGKQVAAFPVAHTADGLARLIAALARVGDPAGIPIAIERPNGRLVDVLLEAGHPVVPVSPNAIKTWRDGEVMSGAKSDAGDAALIAEYLRLRQHKLRVAAPYSGQTTALRTVTRTRGDLVDTRVATANQLTALLEAHRPGAGVIFADIASPIALAFLIRYPTPAAAAGLGEKRMAAFCTRNSYSGRRTAAELLARLRGAPAGTLEPAQTQALHDAVLALAGVTPVTKASGKHRSVEFRWACNKRFRQALTTFADNSRHASPWAAQIYNAARASGKDHPHAIRILARAWVRVIYRCWLNNQPYDPAKHGAAATLIEPKAA
jgi:transposase